MAKSSGLLAEIEHAATAGPRKGRCAVAVVLEQLGPEADELTQALASSFAGASIGRALRGRGFSVSDYTINRHRRGLCSCPVVTK